jgi:hypothetical protein
LVDDGCLRQTGDIPGWTSKFIGRAKNGVYHGHVGDEGKPGWTAYDGTIERDGRIEITQKGVVGDSSTALKHASSGTNFSWPFAGHFEQSRGNALRVVGRTCGAEFDKQ